MCHLSFLPTAEQGREGGSPAAARAGGVQGRRPGARERLWSEGKKRGRREGPIPSLTLDWDRARRWGSGGVRWPAEASVAAALEARRWWAGWRCGLREWRSGAGGPFIGEQDGGAARAGGRLASSAGGH